MSSTTTSTITISRGPIFGIVTHGSGVNGPPVRDYLRSKLR
jgi:hypothetical protein